MAPGRLPLIGHTLPMIRDRLAFVQQVRDYGPIVRLKFGPMTVTAINSPEFIHQMLTLKSNSFSKGLLGDKLKLFGKEALPVAEGKPHLKRRRLLQPNFHREQIRQSVDNMRETVEPTIGSWQPGEVLNLNKEMQLMAQDVAMSVLASFRADRDRARGILHAVDTVFRAAIRRVLLPVTLLERLPTRKNRELEAARALLAREVGAIIEDHRRNPDDYEDLLSMLLEVRDEKGEPLRENELLSEIIGLLAAGSETTGVTLSWLFHELGQNPELEARLHAEVDSVVGDGPITAEHIPRLDLTRRLVHETLRLYHPGWLVTRQTTEPVRLGEYLLPAGQHILWSIYSLHRDPEIYPDPLRFDPDRWLPDRPQPPRGAFIPFGSGKRMCIGDAFAMTESVIMVALVASRWRVRPAPGENVRQLGELTVHPSSLNMVVEPRERSARAGADRPGTDRPAEPGRSAEAA